MPPTCKLDACGAATHHQYRQQSHALLSRPAQCSPSAQADVATASDEPLSPKYHGVLSPGAAGLFRPYGCEVPSSVATAESTAPGLLQAAETSGKHRS